MAQDISNLPAGDLTMGAFIHTDTHATTTMGGMVAPTAGDPDDHLTSAEEGAMGVINPAVQGAQHVPNPAHPGSTSV